MAPTQPYYMIDFSASACSLEIRVNDIPAVTLTLKGQASTRIPVNYLLPESGSQRLSLKMLPLPGNTQLLKQKATASYTLELFDVKN